MDADQELPDDQLPAGHTPVWIEPPISSTILQRLERVKMETIVGQYEDVMVLHPGYRDEGAAAWCEERGWQYQHFLSIYGCEAECVILLDCGLRPEQITRGRNMLIIVHQADYKSNR